MNNREANNNIFNNHQVKSQMDVTKLSYLYYSHIYIYIYIYIKIYINRITFLKIYNNKIKFSYSLGETEFMC